MKKIILDKFAMELDGMVQSVEVMIPETPGTRFHLSWTTYSGNDQLIDVSGEVFVSDVPRFRVSVRPKTQDVKGQKINLTVVASWEEEKPRDPDGLGDVVGEADPIDRLLVEAGLKIFGADVRASRKTGLNDLADSINVLFQKKLKGGKP